MTAEGNDASDEPTHEGCGQSWRLCTCCDLCDQPRHLCDCPEDDE